MHLFFEYIYIFSIILEKILERDDRIELLVRKTKTMDSLALDINSNVRKKQLIKVIQIIFLLKRLRIL